MLELILAIASIIVTTDNAGESYKDQLKDNPNSIILIYSENFCKLSNNASSKMPESDKFKTIKINVNNHKDQNKVFNFPTCENVNCGLPTFLFHKSGTVIDIFNHWGYHEDWQKVAMDNFYARNHLDLYPPESINQQMIDSEAARYHDKAEDFNLDLGQGILIGGSFAKRKLKGADFANSDLRATSFEDTTIEGAIFTRANLKGASFKGAKLSNILWGACICPDGTKSSSHGYTCEGHLKPFKYKTLPKTTLKPLPYQRPVPLTDELQDIGKDFERQLAATKAKNAKNAKPATP